MNPVRQILFLVLVFSFSAFSFRAQSPAKPGLARKSGGTISGQVTVHGKGLPGVAVTLRAGGFGQPQNQTAPQATTDADGKYRITDIPIGSYVVMPVAPVYTVPGASRLTAASDAVVITGNETIDNIDFSLVRGGVVTGKVADTDGRPVIDQAVALQNVDYTQQRGGGPPMPMGSFRTDDRGVYRIYGVPAGHYTVSVGAQQRFSAYQTVMGQQAYKQTFHPDVTDQSKATTLEVTEGAEVSTVDITVGRTIDEYSVSGVVLDSSTNAPLPNVGFSLSVLAGGGNRQRSMGLMSLPVVSDSSGQFRIDNVPPGKYQVAVAPQSGAGMFGQSAAFDVINQDVTGIQVSAVRGASLSGIVSLDSSPQDPSIVSELLQFQVQVFVQAPGNRGFGGAEAAASMQTVPLNGDGSFQINGLPVGTARLSLLAQDPTLQGTFKLLRIERSGTAQMQGVNVNSGDNITDVRLVAAYADAIVIGQVKMQNGALPAGSRVVARLSPVGQGRGVPNGGMANVDERGRFLVQNVPAGNYSLTVSAMQDQGGGRGRGRGPGSVSAQQNVTAIEGQVANVTVVLDLGQNPPNPTP
jgi:Carboxypeptidase regulatory-like domain